MQETLVPAPHDAFDPPACPVAYGRGGRGVASILPHLCRQQQINDKPPEEDLPELTAQAGGLEPQD